MDIHQEKLLILDFGSQTTQLIARRIRELGVYCEIHPGDWPATAIRAFDPQGIILSGGPETVVEPESWRADPQVFEQGCPVLGICYGMQTMVQQLGGMVASHAAREFGHTEVIVEIEHPLLSGFDVLSVWMSHGDRVVELPDGFMTLLKSTNAPMAAIVHVSKRFYGLQFHPEVTHTPQGKTILKNFVENICGCSKLWTMDHIIDVTVQALCQRVGEEEVILGLSGGVDSAVCALLLYRAIGSRLHCIFIDNGLLRSNEKEEVEALFKNHCGVDLITVDARTLFLNALCGVSDPEEKRKIIGRLFVDVFQQQARQFPKVRWFAQGTIYPDVVESGASRSGKAHVIKSHHNVGGLGLQLKLKLIEPLRELFKDEVRSMGICLGLPEAWVMRHPFPGPGLAVRVLGEVREEYLAIVRQADAIFIQILREADWYHRISQAFAVFLPVQSVGVKGDARCYDYVLALRAVETTDFMTARWVELPHALLAHVANRILNEVSQVSRVVYDISSKPPATIEWE